MAYARLDAILNPPDPHGIYLASRPVQGSGKGLFRHEVIVDARWFRPTPVVYEQTEQGFRSGTLKDAGPLDIIARAPDADVAGDRLRRVAERCGFAWKRRESSHNTFAHPDGRVIVIPDHGSKDIVRAPLRKIIRDMGLDRDRVPQAAR